MDIMGLKQSPSPPPGGTKTKKSKKQQKKLPKNPHLDERGVEPKTFGKKDSNVLIQLRNSEEL